MKLVAKEVSFKAGNVGLNNGKFLLKLDEEKLFGFSYSRIPATVVLSKVPWPVAYGLASMKKFAPGYCA